MDPDEQNFKECISLFLYKLVLGVLHKKYQIHNKTLSFQWKRNRGRKTANPLYFIENQQKKPRLGAVLRQNLGQIMSSVVQKVKEQVISLGFFMFYLGITF